MRRIIINILLLLLFIGAMLGIALPFVAQAQVNTGNRLFTEGHWEESQQAYQTALKLAPLSSSNWISYGDFLWEWAYAQDNDTAWEQIEPAYARATALNPEGAEGWIKLAQVQHAKGRVAEAMENFNKAHEKDPRGPDTAYWIKEYQVLKTE